jgi:hypothetical protein
MKKLYLLLIILVSCAPNRKISEEKENLFSNQNGQGQYFEISFEKGKYYNHPSFAIWIEDLEGDYIETLFVTKFVASGVFGHGELEPGKWDKTPGRARRPAALPYWSHKRGILAPDGLYTPSPETSVVDALSGATPKTNFWLETRATSKLTSKFRLLMEINQPWDSNNNWNNAKFPGDWDYFSSLQPALVYAVTIDPQNTETEYFLNPIGHSQPSGKDGKLYTDLSTITSAKEIADKISVRIR